MGFVYLFLDKQTNPLFLNELVIYSHHFFRPFPERGNK
jgi:hypothetical protein